MTNNDFGQFYAAFEERYRGSFDDIKSRFEVYLPIIGEVGAGGQLGPILDLGTGRGEWLHLLKERGLKAEGVDQNPYSAEKGLLEGLSIQVGDLFETLASQPSQTFGAVTAFHVIEHLDWKQQLNLFAEAYRILVPGGLLILEWPNIENLRVSTYNFWLDPTHFRPLPLHLISFMAEFSGFTDIRTERFRPGPPISPKTSAPQRLLSKLRVILSGGGFRLRTTDDLAVKTLNDLLTPGADIALWARRPL